MDKLDFILLFIIYSLRMTEILLLLLLPYYNYWFHSNSNSTLRHDFVRWVRFLFGMLVCFGLRLLHVTLKLSVGLLQLLPGWTMLCFWPRFYWHILMDPDGRSLFVMLKDPRFT